MATPFFSFPNPSCTVKAPTQLLLEAILESPSAFLCIFYDNFTQNISLEFCLLIKVIIVWCVHHLEGPRWHSESWYKWAVIRVFTHLTLWHSVRFSTILGLNNRRPPPLCGKCIAPGHLIVHLRLQNLLFQVGVMSKDTQRQYNSIPWSKIVKEMML